MYQFINAQSFQVQHQTTFKNKEPVLLLTCEVCHILRYPAQCLELLGDDFSHLLVSVGLYFPEAIAGLPSKLYTMLNVRVKIEWGLEVPNQVIYSKHM